MKEEEGGVGTGTNQGHPITRTRSILKMRSPVICYSGRAITLRRYRSYSILYNGPLKATVVIGSSRGGCGNTTASFFRAILISLDDQGFRAAIS